jgi:hypothetical protein
MSCGRSARATARAGHRDVPPFTTYQHFASEESRLIVMSNRILKEMGFDWIDQVENAPGL